MSRRGRAVGFLARRRCWPRSPRPRSPTVTAAASPAATGRCARCWSPPPTCEAGEEDRPRGRRREARGAAGAGPLRAARRPGRAAGSARAGARGRRSRPAPTCSPSQLRPPRAPAAGARLGHGRRPVEIAVSGAGALSAAGRAAGRHRGRRRRHHRTERLRRRPHLRRRRRRCRCWPSARAPEGGARRSATATLGLTRSQALRLIAAESFARRVTVMPRG